MRLVTFAADEIGVFVGCEVRQADEDRRGGKRRTERSDAVVIVTEWPEFNDLDFARLAEVMRGDLLFDGRNAIDAEKVRTAGLTYEGIGRGEIFYARPAFQSIPE